MIGSIQPYVLKLIERYVQRQSIVLDAMRDLRPDLILPIESKVDPQTRAELRQKYAGSLTKGFWGKNREWEYRLHGIGCHLTHTETDEVIGWDVGSLKRFDWTWFVDYLLWLLKSETIDNEFNFLNDEFQDVLTDRIKLGNVIFPIIQQLEKKGFLRKERENRYTLMT